MGKIARMARIARALRMIRFLSRIRIMAVMIVGSMNSLFWLFVLLAGVMYVFAIIITSGATDWRKPEEYVEPPWEHKHWVLMEKYYGSVLRTVYTLFMAMTGGISWGEPADVLEVAGIVYWALYTYFIFFTFFSILNIVTGVFVDSAIQKADGDRAMILQKAYTERKSIQEQLTLLLNNMDEDNSGFLTLEEWKQALTETRFRDDMMAAMDGFDI